MKYKYWFMQLKNVSLGTKHLLLQTFKTAKEIYEVKEEVLKQIEFVTPELVKTIQTSKEQWNLEEEYKGFARSGQSMVTLEDAAYPEKLRQIYHPPYGLYFRGELPENEAPTVAIVGARNCSAYGKMVATDLAKSLGEMGYWVISGMAKGIDSAAHEGCLAGNGKTVAVLGCGVDVCYPSCHKGLKQRIENQGCVLSEYPPGQNPIPQFFPARNRLISGMADRVIVVEARKKSGSLITTDFALEQGRDVYAIPGRVTDVISEGCNQLIQQGAGIITSLDEFLSNIEEIQWKTTVSGDFIKGNELALEKEERLVYSCFDFYPKNIEQVLEETKMEVLPLLSIVMDLCDKGYLKEIFKNNYIKCK